MQQQRDILRVGEMTSDKYIKRYIDAGYALGEAKSEANKLLGVLDESLPIGIDLTFKYNDFEVRIHLTDKGPLDYLK